MIELAKALRAEVDTAAVRLESLGEAEVGRDRGAGKWTKKEILGHLIDSAANNHQRFVRARLEERLVSPAYDQRAWVSIHRYAGRPWPELVGLWAALNRHVAEVIESVPAEGLQVPCTIGGGEPVSLEWLMWDYLRHLKHHLAQIVAE